jgi:hypothetical protein
MITRIRTTNANSNKNHCAMGLTQLIKELLAGAGNALQVSMSLIKCEVSKPGMAP